MVLYFQNDDEVFLLLGEDRDERGWSAFGGGAHEGESVKETAARETSEETRGYFKKDWLLEQLEGKVAVKSNGFHLFFVEVPFVPAMRVTRNEISEKTESALTEMSHFAWVPVSDLEQVLAGQSEAIEERFLPTTSKSDFYWSIWLANMRDAYRHRACPWLDKKEPVKEVSP